MELDGQRQRNALTAAERALEAIGAGAPDRARLNATKAAELDQLGVFGDLAVAVDGAAAELERSGAVDAATWEAMRAAVPPGPLQALVDSLTG